MSKKLLFVSIVIALSAVVSFYFFMLKPSHAVTVSTSKIDGVLLPEAQAIKDFKLIDHQGHPFTQANLKGKWTLLFFGFTNCGYVCPTTLTALNKMDQILLQKLKPEQMPQVVLVTVDPERDSIKKLNQYIKAFNPRFIAVRGELPATTAFEKQLHIVAVKVKTKQDYYYDHSAEVLVFNPAGKLQAYFSYPHEPVKMSEDYQFLLNHYAS